MYVTDAQVSACILSEEAEQVFKTPGGMTFLHKYVQYGMERTDAPAVYHLAVGLALLASATPKEFALGGTFGAVTYPNLYVMLIGPSAARKTHAAALGFDQVFAPALPSRIGNLPGSYEGLLESLAEKPQQCIFDPEMSRFYRQARSEGGHLGPLKQGLTDVYDCKKISRQTRKVKIQPQDTHRLNMIGCIALDEFQANIEATDITGGFVSRFLLAMGSRSWLKKLDPHQTYQHQPIQLAAHLRWVANACPQNLAYMSPEATEFANEVVVAWDTVEQGLDLKRWASIWERASAMSRKIALLLALDRYALEADLPFERHPIDGSLMLAQGIKAESLPPVQIGVKDMKKAVEITKLFIGPAVHLVERLPTSRQGREIEMVFRAVENVARESHRKGVAGATFGAISRDAGTNKRTTQHMLDTLIEQGRITAIPCDKGMALYNPRPVRDGVDPSWENMPGGFDPERPPQLLTSHPLPANVVPFKATPTPTPALTPMSYDEAKKLGLTED